MKQGRRQSERDTMPHRPVRVGSKKPYKRHCKSASIGETVVGRGTKEWLRVRRIFFVTLLIGVVPLTVNIKLLSSGDFLESNIEGGTYNQVAARQPIPIFYNLYVHNKSDVPRVLDIINEQMGEIRPNQHGPIFMTSIGTPLKFLIQATASYVPNGTEMSTLHSLWQYCQRNPHKKVVYMHSKGSFHPTKENEKLRPFLTKAALSKQCSNLPSECNVCSARFSPIPHAHTSGNMWLARCSYVQLLMDPLEFEDAMDQLYPNTTEDLLSCRGQGRFAAEHWIHSHPKASPCDLYKNQSYVWGYNGLPHTKEEYDYDLLLAPRFPSLNNYLSDQVKAICPDSLDLRLREYNSLYGQTPGINESSWWGWRVEEYDFNSRLNPAKGALPTQETQVKETKKDLSDDKQIVIAAATKVPIEDAFGRCKGATFEPWLEKDQVPTAKPDLREYVYEAAKAKSPPRVKKRILIIATLPHDEAHILSLWSQLECFAIEVKHVIISAPPQQQQIVETILALAKKNIPHFNTGQVTLEASFNINNRYDVGLWCDALLSLKQGGHDNEFEEYGLINDSVFALRAFAGVLDNLVHKNVHMTSLSYSLTGKYFVGYGPDHYWVESVFRGFDQKGIDIFRHYSCVPADHPFYCPGQDDTTVKGCIVNNFEHDLAAQYPCDKVHGLYPSDVPWRQEVDEPFWIKHPRYWRFLVEHMDFPIAKVNQPDQIIGSFQNNTLLKMCTKHFARHELLDKHHGGVRYKHLFDS